MSFDNDELTHYNLPGKRKFDSEAVTSTSRSLDTTPITRTASPEAPVSPPPIVPTYTRRRRRHPLKEQVIGAHTLLFAATITSSKTMYLWPDLIFETQNTAPYYPYASYIPTEHDLISEEPTQPDRGRTRPPLQGSHGPAGQKIVDEYSPEQPDCKYRDGFYSRGKGELANALLWSAAGSSVRLQPDSSRRYTTPDSVASTNCSTVASPDSDESLETSSASSCDSDIVAPEQRQNPRRTSLSRGITPPSFQRCDKGHKVFIEGLLAVTTSFVEAIWPLSRETPRSSTDFNGAGVLPLRTFIQETCRRSRTSYSTLQIALYYLVLLKGVLPDLDFTREQPRESDIADIVPRDPHVLLGQPRGPSGCRVMQCGRRMFMSALMLAAKYLQDRNFSVKAWAKISGLSCSEINKNEKAYLQSIEYRLHLKKEHFENWSQIVVELCHSEKNKRSLDYLKIIRRLKPEIIHDPENTKHFLKEVGEGRYHAVSPSGGCSRPCWRTCKDDNNNYPGPQIMQTPSMSLHPVLHKAAALVLGIGESTHHDDHIPVANIYSCPPPRPGYTSMSTTFREHIVSPPWSLSARSTESSSSSPESALGSVFSDNAEIVSRSRSSSISSAASFGSLQSFRLDAKATPYPSPLRRSIITAANNLDAGNADFKGRTLVTDQPSHLNVTPNRSQTLVGCAKRKACSALMSSENAAATLVILSKHREQHSIISAAEDKTMSSKKASKKRGPIKGLKAGHTSESVKAKRQLQRETLRRVKSGHPLPDGFPNDSLPRSDYPHRPQSDDNWSSSEETEVGEEEKENQVGHKTWAESRKPVLALHNPNKRCATSAPDIAASMLLAEMEEMMDLVPR